ncbi:hypothetical protein HNR01_002019 [Methylorubrum rhodesianum]|uniref:hypothetical protein n=1 Tax=Methylorubrum rhodesianum TaxID=29427 RepID=UPI00160962A7|nr:hypothetical protein [Methylorubrum rhodesianum]MBB5762399.1 hypothetical protein [Methylorubrum rhodesianum]
MANFFDQFDDKPAPKASGAEPAADGSNFFDRFDEAPKTSKAEGKSVAADVVDQAGAGIIRGAAGVLDLPQTVWGLADQFTGLMAQGVARGIGRALGRPAVPDSEMQARREALKGPIPAPHELPKPGEIALSGVEAVAGKLPKAETVPGQYVGTIAEFIPGGGKTIATAARNALVPAIASETAGQVTKGTEAEPIARLVGGVAGGAAQAFTRRPGTAERLFDAGAGKISADEVTAVRSLVDDAAARGVLLTWAEALQQVVGPRRLGDLQRVVEGQGGLSEFFAARPGQIDAAGQAGLDAITPASTSSARTGEAVQAAARSAVAATPEGQAVIRATQAAGPRVSPDQAGQVIQREMRGVADARETARSEQAARDYAAARAAPERIGIERTVEVERPGEPVLQTLDNGAGGPLRYDPPPQGPDTIGSMAPKRPDAPPVAPGTKSLARFIAENGGIGLERGDVKAAGLDRFRQPGVSNLVQENGKGIDNFWRERLIEEGYLPPDRDGGMARNIHDELIGLLEQEARGRRTYPWDWLGHDDRSGFGAMRDEFQASASQATTDIRRALTEAGVDPKTVDKGTLDRAAAALMRGDETDPLSAYERVVMASKEPASGPSSRMVPTTVTEEISAPRFGQVNPQPAIDAIDAALATAKGNVRSALEAVRRDLHGNLPDPVSGVRETELTIDGLHQTRERLDQVLREARKAGDGVMVSRLQSVRSAIDEQLKTAPEMAVADANFAANSRPLEPFAGNAPLGRVTQRDPETRRLNTPAEQVPSHLEGATAAREFLANATPAARNAFEAREVTRILDGVSGQGGATAERIRAAMRQNEDLLALLPEARGRLQRLALAHQGREAVERSPLGRIAERPDLKRAIDALFPTKPVEGSSADVGAAVGAISRSNSLAARELVRTYLGTEFAAKTKDLQSGANQAGGAKFAASIRGNDLAGENVFAAIRALPDGERLAAGFSRLLDIFEATGTRQGVGSRTSFNNEALAELRKGGLGGEANKALATGGLNLPKRIAQAFEDWQAGRNVDRLAALLTTPEGGRRLADLAAARPGADTIALLNRLVLLGGRGYGSGDREPLQLTVRPVK